MTVARHVYAALGLATLLTAFSVSSTHHTVALAAPTQTQNVNVVNTPNVNVSTLPAVQIGANNTVTVGNSPTVNIGANQSVGISGEPTLHVDPNDTVKVGGDVNAHIGSNESIAINNTPANPIPVSVAFAHTPVDANHSFFLSDGQSSGGVTLYSVPSGKRLIVQNVSVSAQFPTGETINASVARNGSSTFEFMIPMTQHSSWGTTEDTFSGALTGTSIVYEAGDILFVEVARPMSVGTGNFEGSFSGYLEDAS